MAAVLISLGAAALCFFLFYALIQIKIKPQQKLSQRLQAIDMADDAIDVGVSRSIAGARKSLAREKPSFRQRVIIPLRDSLGHFITNLAPATWLRELEHKLVLAGKSRVWSCQAYALFWAMMIAMGVFLGIRYTANAADMPFMQSTMLVVVFGVLFGMMPLVALRILIQKRQELILRQMPEILDLLCVSVQAGLTFDAALRRIVDKMQGPLID